MDFYTGCRVRWLSNERPYGLNFRDEGEVLAMGTGCCGSWKTATAWVKFDKLDRSICVRLAQLIRIRQEEGL